jgi:hypothetical protein
MINNDANILPHLEKHLGKMASGLLVKQAGEPLPIQVAKFERQPIGDSTTFTTLGLSNVPLQQPDGSEIRQELLFSLRNAEPVSADIAKLLVLVATDVLESKKALLRGQVLGPLGPLIGNCNKEALYVTYPVYFPVEFHTYTISHPQISVIWVVPITAAEANYVKRFGWSSFEDQLSGQDPDLLDLGRSPLNL